MQAVKPTITINLDDAVFEVDKMSPEVQQMIAYFDDWRQKELDLTSELLMVRSALRDIQATLTDTIQQERVTALKKAEALGIISPATQPEGQEPSEPKDESNEAD